MFPETSTLLTWYLRGQFVVAIIVILGVIAVGIWAFLEWRKQKKQEKEWNLEQR